MTIGTYQELFHYAAFPVFAVPHGTDKVVYKNFACEQHLPGVSKRKSIKPFIFSQNFTGVGPVELTEKGLYHTAIALKDEKYSVFLFLSYLQCEDGMYRAAQLVSRFGSDFSDFLSSLRCNLPLKTTGSVLQGTNMEAYAETVAFWLDEDVFSFRKQNDLCPIVSYVFEKLNSDFAKFGYRVNARVDEDYPRYLETKYSVYDVIFVLGRLLYLLMKVSKTGEVNLLLSCDIAFSNHTFYMKVATNLTGVADDPKELKDWLMSFIPECKMEFSLLFRLGLLSEENFIPRIDRFGNLTLLYKVPYISPETYYVRSVDDLDIFTSYAIDDMLENLIARLTDNGAFC